MIKYLKLIFIYIRYLNLLPKAIRLRKSTLFSSKYYLATYSDIENMFLLPELHFLRHGMYERRNPHPLFDTAYYLNQIPNFIQFKTDPISHFLDKGAAKGLDPHPLFNVNFYTRNCPSAISVNPLEHYLNNYDLDDAEPNPLFITSDYKNKIDIVGFKEAPLLYYIKHNSHKIQTFTHKSLKEINQNNRFQCYIERFSTFQGVLFVSGWAFSPEKSISQIGYLNSQGSINYLPWQGLPSNDIKKRFGAPAENSRFELKLFEGLPENHLDIVLVFQFTDGAAAYEFDLERYGLQERPHTYFLDGVFIKMLKENPSPARILEIGSRDRSSFVSKDHFIPEWFDYTGTDIMAGENVDTVCDAHEISSFFPNESFDYIFSLNVFEHLLVPWKVVLEINKLLKLGGKVMIFTHQTMPLHDTPCDYWRFSDRAWRALFNEDTGFAINYTDIGDPVNIVAQKVHRGSYTLSLAPAYIHSMVIAEKIDKPRVEWNINIKNIKDSYPVTND